MGLFLMCRDRTGVPGMSFEVEDPESEGPMLVALQHAYDKGIPIRLTNAQSGYRVFDRAEVGTDTYFILVEAMPLH